MQVILPALGQAELSNLDAVFGSGGILGFLAAKRHIIDESTCFELFCSKNFRWRNGLGLPSAALVAGAARLQPQPRRYPARIGDLALFCPQARAMALALRRPLESVSRVC